MAPPQRSDEQARLHVITGKGGVGKTTVATALAVALAEQGARVLLVEVEQRNGIERLLGMPELGYGEVPVPSVTGLTAAALDPRRALQDYLEHYYKLGLAGKLVDRAGAVDFAASIAPGLRDVLLTGKVYEAVRRRDDQGELVYDQVVLDAPPTGRVTKFLNVNAEVSELAKVGPVHNQATSVAELLHSPVTAVHLVTLAEEMPVSETLEALTELADLSLPTGLVIANQLREPVLTLASLRAAGEGALAAPEVAAGLRAAGLDPTLATPLLAEAATHAESVEAQRDQVARLKGHPVVRLPLLDNRPADIADLRALAAPLLKGLQRVFDKPVP